MSRLNYPISLLFIIFGILACTIADGFLTYTLIAKGKVEELNPFMRYLLELGFAPFLAIKYFITALGVIILTVLREKKVFNGNICIGDFLPLIEFLYILLLIYEASALSQLSH